MTLVGHWRLDGNPDNSIGDTTNTENGNPSYTSGKLGQSISLDGNGDYISVSGVRHVGVFGISAWVKTSNTGDNSIFSLWDDNDGVDERYILFGVDNGELRLNVENGTYDSNIIRSNTDIADGNWHHVASSYDGEVMKIYADGELENTLDLSVDIPETNIDWQIGAFSDGEDWNFTGEIDDVRLYDHAISQKEVQQLSQAKALHYRFDDFIGIDSSAQQNNGINNSVSTDTDSVIGSTSGSFTGSEDITGINISDNTPVTISLWFKKSNELTQYLLDGRSDGSWWLLTDYNGFDVNFQNVVEWNGVSDDTWYHVCVTVDSSGTTLYINGDVKDTGSKSSVTLSSVRVGSRYSDSSYLNGNIDDLRIYTESLSQDEVQELYEQRASVDAEGSLYSHELDEDVDNGLSLFVESAGNDSSTGAISNILINGTEVGTDARGINAVEAERDGTTLRAQSFDVYGSPTTETNSLIDFINSSTSGNLLLFAEYDHAGRITDAGVNRFEELGSKLIQDVQNDGRSSWSFICQKGSGRLAEAFAPSGNGPVVAEETLPDSQSIETTGVMSNEQNEVGPAPSSLVGWWPLDGNTRDYAGTSDGTNNGASITSGLGQNAYNFDRSNTNEISLPNLGISGNVSLSLTVWHKLDSNQSHNRDNFFGFGGHSGNDSFSLRYNSDTQLRHYFYGNDLVVTVPNMIGDWHFSSVTYDAKSNTRKIYFDGSLVGSDSPDSGIDMLNEQYSIGGFNNEYFGGKIQDVRLYDRTLTDEEVTQLYNMTDPRQKQQVIQDETGIVQVKNKFDETL